MKNNILKTSLILALATTMGTSAYAESLFRLGVSQSVFPMQPRSLYSTVKARTIGDIITVLIDENASITNDVNLTVNNGSETEDNFTDILEDLTGHNFMPTNLEGFGGSSKTKNTGSVSRNVRIKDTITAQVVQVLPNGNLVIQGKKVAMNTGEKTQMILSGIVDPRLITNAGTIDSDKVANLQVAIVGKGTVSRSEQESIVNRFMNYLF